MDSNQKVQINDLPHPGESVLDYLESFGWSQQDLARRTGLSAKTISEICNGKAPVTPTTALAFERVLGRPAHFWLNLQRDFDECVARRRELARIPQWTEWVKCFPLREMRRLRFELPEAESEVESVLQYFGVSSPDSWKQVWNAAEVSYRQTHKFRATDEAIAAWVRETELVAREIDLAEFDETGLVRLVRKIRSLTRERTEEMFDTLQQMCAQVGLAVVLVPALKNTGISGCARWLSPRKPLVGLTLRHKTDDQLWFTFFHEVGHILLHKNKKSFVIDNAAEDLGDTLVDPEMQKYEQEANAFAADTLIPPNALAEFIRKKVLTNESVHDFAESVGVGPGIVVGRLQHDGILQKHQGNALKQKLNWQFVE